jgi:hypothetical protein
MDDSTAVTQTIIVTAADSKFFGLLKGMVTSVLSHRPHVGPVLGCFDLGLTDEQREWLRGQGVEVKVPITGLKHGVTEDLQGKLGYLARPFLRENFPGYKVYIWLDADTWLQDWATVDLLEAEASAVGGAFVCETDADYPFRPDLFGWKAINFRRGYGLLTGIRLLLYPHINNGVFALRADAPHWEIWRGYYQAAIDRCGRYAPFDQFGLNAAVRLQRLPAAFLPATSNWICDLALPVWNDKTSRFSKPGQPATPISVMHLAGLAKTGSKNVRTTNGEWLIGGLRYDDSRRHSVAAAGDGGRLFP